VSESSVLRSGHTHQVEIANDGLNATRKKTSKVKDESAFVSTTPAQAISIQADSPVSRSVKSEAGSLPETVKTSDSDDQLLAQKLEKLRLNNEALNHRLNRIATSN
jgi:hypothetical protein